MWAKRLWLMIGLAGLCGVLLVEIDRAEPLLYLRLRNIYRDGVARAGRVANSDPNLVFLAIDADSVGLDDETDAREMYGLSGQDGIEAKAFRLMTRSFPWPREVYALMTERLIGAGAKVVIFDLTFPTASADDEKFRLALDQYRAHVVVGSNFVNPDRNGMEIVSASHTLPSVTLIPQTTTPDDRVGFTNYWPDADNVVRRVAYQVTFEQVRGDNPASDSERFFSLASLALSKAGFAARVPPGLSPRLIRFAGPPRKGFAPHSVFEIFVPDYWRQNYGSGSFFRDKIVVIGAEGNWQHDEHETPFGSMPGPEIHLNAINAALHDEFITELPGGAVILMVVLAGAMAVLVSIIQASPWFRLLTLVGINALAGWAAVSLFDHVSVYLPLVLPLTELNAAALLGLVADFTVEWLDKGRLRRTLERYVSRDVVHEMLDSPGSYQEALGGSIKPVTILFSDIRGYSLMSAQSNPHALVNQLNEYLGAMVECVFRFGGTLDKFIGDAVMAVWGSIHTQGTARDADNAVRAALAMQQELAALNQRWLSKGWPQLRTGIAVHRGDVVVGNVGSPQRMEFTVIGDAVNATWKLQELTKGLGCDFVLTERVRAEIGEDIPLRSLGFVNLPGSKQSLEVFTSAESVAANESSRRKQSIGEENTHIVQH